MLTREQLEQLSKPQLIDIVLLLQDQNRLLQERVRILEEKNKQLEARVAELERQLGQNSSNSSKPPSSDPPWLPSKKKPKTGRKPGGQPGHEGHHRELVDADQVPDLRKVFPVQSCDCGARLPRGESDPRRYQWLELPEVVEPELHEVQLFSSVCPRCGKVHVPVLPPGTPTGAFGPRVHALVALLTGTYRLSKRKAQALLQDMYRLDISLGSISACEAEVSLAVEQPVEEAHEHIQQASSLHADETSWRQGSQKAWLWVAATSLVTVFLIHLHRSGEAAKKLLGAFQGVLVTDRWSAYGFYAGPRQLCWAHLLRYFQGFAERSGKAGMIGQELADKTKTMFKWWHAVRDGTLARSTFQTRMSGLKIEIEDLLIEGEICGPEKMAATCHDILKVAVHLWTFVKEPGVEPTNNAAEQALRHAVIWRKVSFGTHSAGGSLYVARVLTVVATCVQQGRNALDYITAACTARLHHTAAPSLLPLNAVIPA
jgi:transposase